MRNIQFHDNFIPNGYDDPLAITNPGVSAVTVEAGLTWMEVYAEATERNLVCL